MPHRSVKWRLAFLAASFSMILSVASSEELKASRSNLKKALKTESENHLGNPRTVNPNDPKTIDYTLYNYGGNAVLSLTKSHQYLNYTDTQASTIAALGNAALVLGGAMLFGQLNNRIQARTQQELYARGFRHRHAPQPLRKRRLRNRFRKRRLPLRTRPAVRAPIGGRRRLRKNFNTIRKRPIFQHTRKPTYFNQRIEDSYPQTRDQVSVPLRDETYNSQPSSVILDPIKPMLYDPYSMMDSREEHLMDDYYYDDYNYDLPDYSALKGGNEKENVVNTQGRSLTPSEQPLVPPPVQENQIETQAPTRIPIRMPTRMPTRKPLRSESLLNLSEEKRLANLEKERAKLLAATIMKPDEMTTKKPEQERTRIRVPLRRRRKPEEVANEQNNEIKMEMPQMFNRPPMTAFQTSFQKPEEVTFQRPESFKQPESFDRPEMNFNRPNPVPQRNPEYREDNNGNEVEDPFTFRAEMQDPFQEMSSDFDVNNEDWISTISQAFEGFSDFKKLKK